MRATDVQRLSDERGWSRSRLVLELRRAARSRNEALPSDDSLKRMLRLWINGERGLSETYAELFSLVFGVAFEAAVAECANDGDAAGALSEQLSRTGARLDGELVALFEQQTQSFRMLDRRLGARRLVSQTEGHVHQMTDLISFALCGPNRSLLAEALAEAAALAGWQALDLGRPDRAWVLHETAKSAARDSGNAAVIAHVTAQQAYALLDLDRPADAVLQVRHARQVAGARVPGVLRAWLWAAEAEALAAAGEERAARVALDRASSAVADAAGDELPYVFLDHAHLARWRGHCLARLGAVEAVDELSSALAGHDSSFTRAHAGLLVDLALAHSARGELDAVREHAAHASELVEATTSARQKRRLERLLKLSA